MKVTQITAILTSSLAPKHTKLNGIHGTQDQRMAVICYQCSFQRKGTSDLVLMFLSQLPQNVMLQACERQRPITWATITHKTSCSIFQNSNAFLSHCQRRSLPGFGKIKSIAALPSNPFSHRKTEGRLETKTPKILLYLPTYPLFFLASLLSLISSRSFSRYCFTYFSARWNTSFLLAYDA